MTHDEFLEMVEYLETRWGGLHKGWANIGAVYSDFAGVPRDMAMEACRDVYHSGRQSGPSPSMVVQLVRERQSALRGVPTSIPPEHCKVHRWGWVEGLGTTRDASCVLCGTERTFNAHELLSPSEMETAPIPAEAPDDRPDTW